jgi:hypothetical protein
MSRFYILVPDIKKIRQFIKTLKKQGIPREAVRFVHPRDHLELNQVLDASVFETSDVFSALIRGSMIGGIAGLIAGILTKDFFFGYLVVDKFSLMIAFSVFGMAFGAWASSLIGVSVVNASLKEFERALDKGQVMIQVDVKQEKERALLDKIKLNYPEITVQDAEAKRSF